MASNQPTPQTLSKEGPLSFGMNNGIDTTEATNNGMFNSSTEVAKTVSTNVTETTTTEYKFQWKKISRSARKRYHMFKEEGIPMEKARKLCRIDRSTLEHMLLLTPQKRNNPEAPQGPPNKTLKMSTEIDKQNSLSSNDTGPLRVGITNSQSMSEDQMRILRQNLITAIQGQCLDGCGPVFLGFSHKAGWVLVTCGNQRSKDWLVNEVPYQEPWRGAQLSIIPDQELPKQPRAVTLIPDSEGVSVDEALKLLKIQNSGLNTELWNVRCEKVEKEGKTVYFTIDDPSADVLRAQNCQASFGFETVTFKINGQYRVYTPRSTQNQVPATQGSSSKPLSQSFNGKSSDQSKKAAVTIKVEPSSAARCQLSQATGRDHVQSIQHQDYQPPAKKTRFAYGSGEITSLKKPAALAVGQSMSQTTGETRPITENSQGHGNTPLVQPNLGGPVNGESSTSAGKPPFIQPSQGRPVIRESLISAKGLAPKATRWAAQQINQESQCHGKTSFIQASQGRPVIRESLFSAEALPPQATTRVAIQNNTNTQHIIQGSQSERTPAGGGYHTWGIEDLESYTTRLTQGNPTATLKSAAGIWPLATGYIPQSSATQLVQGSTSTNRQTLVNRVSPQGRDSNGAMIIGSESHERPVYGSRTMTGQSRPDKGLLPHPSGSFEPRTIEPKSHGRPFHGSRIVTGQEARPGGLLPHLGGSFGLESYGRPLQDSGALTDRESMPGLLPRPSGFEIEPENRGRPFLQNSRAMVTNRGSMSNRRLSPQGRGSSGGLQGSKWSLNDRDSRTDRRLSPHARGSYGGRQDSETHRRRFQGSKRTLADRDSRPDRRRLPYTRGNYGGRQDSETHRRRFQGSKRSLADRDSRPDRRRLPYTRGNYGGRQDSETHRRRFQGSKRSLANRDSRTDRRLSPYIRGSYGGRQDSERLPWGSKRSLTDRHSRPDTSRKR